jgi:hypothetical protein
MNMHNSASSSQRSHFGIGDDDRDDATEGMDLPWLAGLAFDERSVTIPMHLIEKDIEELMTWNASPHKTVAGTLCTPVGVDNGVGDDPEFGKGAIVPGVGFVSEQTTCGDVPHAKCPSLF